MTLLFKKQFINLIRDGTKTQTRRLNQPRVKIGKTYRLRYNYRETLPDRIQIMDIFQQNLGELDDHDARCEGFQSIDEFNQIWMDLYGFYDPHAYIWVIEFQYVGVTDMFKQKSSG